MDLRKEELDKWINETMRNGSDKKEKVKKGEEKKAGC